MPRKAEEAMEDYLEVINLLVAQKGFPSASDVAERMSVSKPTATNILKNLDKRGYIMYERYRVRGRGESIQMIPVRIMWRTE